MKLNDQVEVIQPTVTGAVVDVQWDKVAGKLRVLVQVAEDQQRWFDADQLKVTKGA